MFRNYFQTAIRNILRHKLLYGINVLGLIIGLTTSMLLLNYVIFETSFDKFHTQGSNIYRMISEPFVEGEALDKSVPVPYTHGALAAENFAEVQDYIRIRIPGGLAGLNQISYRDKEFSNDQIYFADEKFLKYFSFPLIKGDPKTALTEIFSIVLTESAARKYFGDEEPMGKMLEINSKKYKYSCTVTGIMKDLPMNSSMRFDLVMSFKTYMYQDDNRLLNDGQRHSFATFLVLAPGTDPVKLSEKYEPLLKAHMSEWFTKVIRFKFSLQPLADMHLHSGYLYDRNEIGSWKTVYFFLIIAILVLPICIVNYISFFSTQALERVRELGMRKVLGGTRYQIIFQFITESFLINLIAFCFAILSAIIVSVYFNELTEKNTPLIIFSNFYYASVLFISFIAISIISGAYPALSLSSLKPSTALSGKTGYKHSKGGVIFRNGLTVFQFSISLIAIICTLVIYLQIEFMKSQDLGVDIDKIIVMKTPASRDSVQQVIRQSFIDELKTNANIINASQSNAIPGFDAFDADLFPLNKDRVAHLYVLQVDQNFMNTYNFKFVSGRDFTKEDGLASVIINESALHHLKLKDADDALGKKLFEFYTIVGVVKNHRQLHFTKNVYPFVFILEPSRYAYFSVKYSGENESDIISLIENKWKQFFPATPLEYFFQDEFFNRQYKNDNTFGKLFGLSALLTIILSCIGVFGLAYFDVVQRTKEIGIRKVLGANLDSLLITLSKGTVILLVIANLIAWPAAYYIMTEWLSNYSARIGMPIWAFAACCMIVFFVVFATISFQFIRIAKRNPTDALRVE
jgi:putative ABC transport system permease protein